VAKEQIDKIFDTVLLVVLMLQMSGLELLQILNEKTSGQFYL